MHGTNVKIGYVFIYAIAVSLALMGLSFAIIFVVSIDICIESGQLVVNHVAVDKLSGFHVSGQHFVFVTVTVPTFFVDRMCKPRNKIYIE